MLARKITKRYTSFFATGPIGSISSGYLGTSRLASRPLSTIQHHENGQSWSHESTLSPPPHTHTPWSIWHHLLPFHFDRLKWPWGLEETVSSILATIFKMRGNFLFIAAVKRRTEQCSRHRLRIYVISISKIQLLFYWLKKIIITPIYFLVLRW